MTAEALRSELGTAGAALLVARIEAELLPLRSALSPALVVDEWTALAAAAERIASELDSDLLAAWGGRIREASDELDADALDETAAELFAVLIAAGRAAAGHTAAGRVD